MNQCTVDGCTSRSDARGMCGKHYQTWRRHGDPLATVRTLVEPGMECSIDDCSKQAKTKGLCVAHYTRQRRHGDPLAIVRKPAAPPTDPQQCKRCGELKPLAEFSLATDGPTKYCRPCAAIRQAEWRQANREHHQSYIGSRRDRINELKRARRKERRSTDEVYAERERQASREWHRRNAEHRNMVRKLRKFGLTEEQFRALLDQQSDGCAICGSKVPNGRGKLLIVDHDHACCPGIYSCGKCVRGLLCSPCNTAIGLLGESPDRLQAAATYLQRFTRRSAS